MLKVIKSMSELHLVGLMAVYAGSNRKNGAVFFPDDSIEEQTKKAEQEFLSYLREDFFRQRDAYYYIWEADGIYQSALRLEPYRDGLLIEALETAPNARCKGYARRLVCEVLLLQTGTKWKCIYAHVNKKNIPSLKVHEKCGFQRIAESATYVDGTVTTNSCTMCYLL